MSTANSDFRTRRHTTGPVGVAGMPPPTARYSPALHNPPAEMRPGAQDFLTCPSLNPAGDRIPYWGNK